MAGFLGRGTIRTRTYDSRFEASFRRGGAAADFVNLQLAWVQSGAERRTPVRTGRLRRGWKSTGVLKTGRLHARGQVYNGVAYAPYVQYGTRSPILPRTARRLAVHLRSGRVIFKKKVRGQRAQDMIGAGERLARQHVAGDARLTRATH